jgi:2-dehydro-3-deoxy-D-arabinonate dehydratase
VFFKSTPHRIVGHKAFVRIRKDSTWDVPEPELTLVVTSSGKIIGYTIGNDMSSRSIEGENPLYLATGKNLMMVVRIGSMYLYYR